MRLKIIQKMLYILLIYVLIGSILFFYQRKLIYFPTPIIPHVYENIQLTHNNIELNVIVLNKGKKEAIIYFGGNAEAVVYNAPHFLDIFPDYTVYLINYRGYGGSTGQPNEKGFFSDALFLFDKVLIEHSKISVVGRSLGSGVATFLASKRSVKKLVLITPFDSVTSLAQRKFIIFPVFLMLLDKYDSIIRVKDIKAEVNVIIADNDEVISKAHSQRLIDEFDLHQISVNIISDSGHNDISEKEKYYKILKDFFSL